jgi:hypothetical protein
VIDKRNKTYQLRDPRIFGVPYLLGFESFVDDKQTKLSSVLKPEGSTLVTFDGKLAAKVPTGDQVIYIDAKTALPVGCEYKVGATKYLLRYRDVQLNKDLRTDAFSFNPSSGMKEIPVDTLSMIKIGERAPSIDGSAAQKALGNYVSDKKVTVVAFVQSNSSASSAFVQKMRDLSKSSPKELGMVVVSNTRDTGKLVKGKLGLPLIVEGGVKDLLTSAYGVTNYPTIYILDSEGVVRHRQIGGSESLIREALSSLDVVLP